MSEELRDIKVELAAMRAALEGLAAGLGPAGQSRPLTAGELMVRWGIQGETEAHRLDTLAKRCRAWGLRPMRGTRGMSATYMVADVVAAEAFGNGTSNRRRRAA